MLLYIVLLLPLVLIFLYWKCIQPHSYWRSIGVKQGKQFPLLGNSAGLVFQKQTLPEMVESVYNQFPKERFSGIYQFLRPFLLIRDPELIKQLTIKDFDYFTDHISIIFSEDEPIWGKNLFGLKGEQWRDMRATLSPTFTSRKMRIMFELMSECAKQIPKYFESQGSKVHIIELKDTFSRFTNDAIATCAFGVQCDSLKYRENEFYMMGNLTVMKGFWSKFTFFMNLFWPKACKLMGLNMFPKKLAVFFKELIGDTIRIREEQNIIRPDMVHLMMEAQKGRLSYEEDALGEKESGFAVVEESDIGKTHNKRKREITVDDITSQALLFFLAGFDSVSSLACFIGYELAVNPDIQHRLFEEIETAWKESGGDITYGILNKMTYLDMIVSEALRKWPLAAAIDRVCVSPYTIKSTHSGEPDVHLRKGDAIWLPIWGIHRDAKYYPNPERFDPERFNDVNKANIQPYTYLPFGMGPRNCIASRFALLETKTVFFHILAKFEIVVVEKTPIPLKLTSAGFNINATNGFWVGLKRRNVLN